MSWILVICLLGAGGMFPQTKSMNDILEINKNLIPREDPASSFLSEGDIIRSVTSRFSPRLFLWPLVNKTVVIPYDLSPFYDEYQRNVIFEAFKDLEASTCIRFVERTTQRDYISILPGSGCYSSVGRVGKRQVVSLAFQCVERGKGVILHELMHVIGFWHEHSREDRDAYVTIHWNAIGKENWLNFCKYETTNMVVKYDLESLLHYSRIAFAKSGDITIEPRDSHAHMGQRIKLSDSDILRVNKLYHCPQYIPSEDDDEDDMVLDNPAPGVATCLEANMNDPESRSTAMFTKSLTTARLSLKERGTTSPPIKEHKTSPVAFYSSSLESKTGSTPTSFSSQESKLESTGFIYSSPQEPTHSIMGLSMPKGDTILESTTGTAAPENKRTVAIIDVMEENQISASSHASKTQEQSISEDTGSSSGSGEGPNVSQDQDEHVKKNLQLLVRKRSLAGRTFDSWPWQLPRWRHSKKLTYLHNDRRKSSSESIEPFCGFEHGFCGWKQSTEDDLDWKLSRGSLNVNVGHFTPEGFHLSLKNSPEVSVVEQSALLLRSIVQPTNCISFWYSLRHGITSTLNVYITSSGGEQTLLWTSGGQDCVKWTKAQIMLPPHPLFNSVYVVVEGVMGLSHRSNIAIDELYVGQCS